MPKIAVLIDGGHLRVHAKAAGYIYDPSLIEKFARACVSPNDGEELFRVLYYDCAPHKGTARLPVSRAEHVFAGDDAWLHELASKDLIAVRRGELKFRGWSLKKALAPPQSPKDKDFKPEFVQKGVDMRIGLDVAAYSANRAVDRIGLVTGDTDCVPAMKYARIAGLQIILLCPAGVKCARDLKAHSDFIREVAWPKGCAKRQAKKKTT